MRPLRSVRRAVGRWLRPIPWVPSKLAEFIAGPTPADRTMPIQGEDRTMRIHSD